MKRIFFTEISVLPILINKMSSKKNIFQTQILSQDITARYFNYVKKLNLILILIL